ncbi:hypothetical protein MPOCJGCO_2138 [Methylobacterium trifolii]|uniref:Class I SAM-dependent methyltransferase n=2 Tax=Methylobacterium trifolii TaxID=1003092 RepID=A0ABQ4TXP1_9HYPH|nr:hypothetical protein MPOCJGCO_2138 [Methylobacterium trifolii]
MLRSDVINQFLKLYDDPDYLEVGVDEGTTFFAVDAPRKVAVDPEFKFALPPDPERAKGCTFHPVPSDSYFAQDPGRRYDLIFLDGLHTFEQILKDFTNALACIKDDGIIIVDDVIPSSYHASLPDLALSFELRRRIGQQDGDWMGDVYKIVFLIESYFQSHSFATVAENHGQLIVWKERRPAESLPARSVEQIGRLGFCDARLSDAFNLMPCSDILARCRRAYGL